MTVRLSFSKAIIAIAVSCFISYGNASPAPTAKATPATWHLPHETGEIMGSPKFLAPSPPVQIKVGKITHSYEFCPEEFTGQSPKPCSECGGLNEKTNLCNKPLPFGVPNGQECGGKPCPGLLCKCVDRKTTAIPGKPTKTVVTTVNKAVATGIYTQTTITKYAGLRASTTVMLTRTTSGDVLGLETAAVVVAAGGVAWYLAGRWLYLCQDFIL